jgi:hypothetical protein
MVDFAHHVPGRLRIQDARLKHNAQAIASLRVELQAINGVASISANVATGSITILYDHYCLTSAVIWETLGQLGFEASTAVRSKPPQSQVTEQIVSIATDHMVKAAIDFALARLVGRPAATLIGALI